MNTSQATGLALLVAAILASRFVSQSAIATLTSQQKSSVREIFSTHRKYSLPILLVGLALAFIFSDLISRKIFFLVFTLSIVVFWVLTYSKLKNLDLGTRFIYQYLASQVVMAFGLVVYLAITGA